MNKKPLDLIEGLFLRGWPGDDGWFRKAVLFYRVEFARGWLSTACLIPDRVAGRVLVGIRVCPPFVKGILTNKEFEQISSIVILCHFYLIPTDRNIIPISTSCHIAGRTIHIAPNRLQIKLLVGDTGDVSTHIHHGRRDPAEVI